MTSALYTGTRLGVRAACRACSLLPPLAPWRRFGRKTPPRPRPRAAEAPSLRRGGCRQLLFKCPKLHLKTCEWAWILQPGREAPCKHLLFILVSALHFVTCKCDLNTFTRLSVFEVNGFFGAGQGSTCSSEPFGKEPRGLGCCSGSLQPRPPAPGKALVEGPTGSLQAAARGDGISAHGFEGWLTVKQLQKLKVKGQGVIPAQCPPGGGCASWCVRVCGG